MNQIEIYIALLAIIIVIAILSAKTPIPTPLSLVIAGMMISVLPEVPQINLNPILVLNVFLPIILYHTASSDFSWRDVKNNIRPIMLLSIGHVLFITCLMAACIHWLIPSLGWPMSFVLGAVISPPDDIAIIAIAEKINMPYRIVTILKGESILNDATALILFRFALAAVLTHQFSAIDAASTFVAVAVGETLYGMALAHTIGKIRMKIKDPILHMLISILTPLLAYIPAEKFGGCGVIATVVTGFIIGNRYVNHFPPEVRLSARSIWPTLTFAIQSILFLLVGLNLRFTLEGISSIPLRTLSIYSAFVIFVVIVGRFVWVYCGAYLPRLLFPSLRKKEPHLPWQQPFIISWAGMRGGISLAAALAVPPLPHMADGTDPGDLLIFLVFVVITATLLAQGLTLPWLLKKLGIREHGEREQYAEHLSELSTRVKISTAVIRWLTAYKNQVKENIALYDKIKLYIQLYKMRREQLRDILTNHTDEIIEHDEREEAHLTTSLATYINEIEREALLRLWEENKISHSVRAKLLQQLDHRFKNIME